MASELKTFLTLSPGDKWHYPQVDLGRGQRALDIQSKIRSKLDQLEVPDHIFAHCIIDGHSRIFQSPLDGVKAVSSFDNAEELSLRAAQTIEEIRAVLQKDLDWLKWFDAIFRNISLYSDGSEVVFVWGLQLTEKEKFSPPPMPNPVSDNNVDRFEQTDPDPDPVPVPDPVPDPDPDPTPKPIPVLVGGPDFVKIPTKTRRWPWLRWFLWLLILFLLLLLFWLLSWCSRPCDSIDIGFINGHEVVNPLPERLPENPNVAIPWNPEDVQQDSTSGQLFFANRWNIAFTEKDKTFDQFVASVDSLIPADKGEIIYWDPLIGRIQCEWADDNPFPAAELRRQLSDYQGLLWPERLMSNGASVLNIETASTDPTWHLNAIGWERQEPNREQGVGIAVVDDGFDLTGSRLAEISRFPLNVQSREPEVSASEFRSHGTHVASLAAAPERGATAFQGVSNSSSLIPVQIQSDDVDMLPMSNIVDGILYATRKGAQVINLSLGIEMPKSWIEMSDSEKQYLRGPFRDLMLDERLFWSHMFESLEEEGVVVVIAAGNYGAPLELDPMHESRYPIYVTASMPDGTLTDFSNTKSIGNDSLVVVSAPGYQVHSWIPGNKLVPMNGTSMSAPIVAGAIAEMMAQNGVMSPREVRQKFQRLSDTSPQAGLKLWFPSLFDNLIDS